MFDELSLFFVNYHIKNNFDYSILFSGVAIYIFQSLYKKGLKNNEIQPMTKEKMTGYEVYAEKYQTKYRSKEQVMMACYVLDFITLK